MDLAPVMPSEPSPVVPTAPEVVAQFYKAFSGEKLNSITRLGEKGYAESGGDLAFFEYFWKTWGEDGPLFVLHKRIFLEKFKSLLDYEKTGGDAGLKVYLRQTFRQVCFDNLALKVTTPKVEASPGTSKVTKESEATKELLTTSPQTTKSPQSPPDRLEEKKETFARVSSVDQLSDTCKRVRTSELTHVKIEFTSPFQDKERALLLFSTLALTNSLVTLDISEGKNFCVDQFKQLLDAFESRTSANPIRKLNLSNQPLSETVETSFWTRGVKLTDQIDRLCKMMRSDILKLSHLNLENTGLPELAVRSLIKLKEEKSTLVYLNLEKNGFGALDVKLASLIVKISDQNPNWDD